MKVVQYAAVLIVILTVVFAGCTQSPVGPSDNTVSLAKKGPVVHRVQGSGLLSLGGKNLGARYTANEYADGSFDGEYEINAANASGDPTFKWNGDVISFKVYDNAGPYSGKMAVFFGQEKTGAYNGWYDVFFAIDNGQPGQSSAPDQVNDYVVTLEDLNATIAGMTIEEWADLPPAEIISYLGTLDCERGNIIVE